MHRINKKVTSTQTKHKKTTERKNDEQKSYWKTAMIKWTPMKWPAILSSEYLVP